MKGVFSNCWTVVLNGNIELSVVMSIADTILSTIVHTKYLFKLCEELFTGGSSVVSTNVDLDVYHILWTLCSTIIPFLLGLSLQCCCRIGKKLADKTIEHIIFSYILTNFGIMTAYTIIDWMHSDVTFKVSFNYHEVATGHVHNKRSECHYVFTLFQFHVLEFLLPIIRYLVAFFFAMCLRQEIEDCLAIATEITVPSKQKSL